MVNQKGDKIRKNLGKRGGCGREGMWQMRRGVANEKGCGK